MLSRWIDCRLEGMVTPPIAALAIEIHELQVLPLGGPMASMIV
jgi:hypothetical protein